ncbi:hypothetical protein LCL95_10555 [Bacillus timonensis]|nr:hypothetical protein [Bacillus timonensis]
MKIGDHVVFNDKVYEVFFMYESGYVEIKDLKNPFKVDLVTEADVTRIE